MNRFQFRIYEPTKSSDWDRVVQQSKNGNFMHLRDYIDYHSHRFDERSVLIERGGVAVAVFPCNQVDDQIISHGGLTYGGLIYGYDLHAKDVLHIFELIQQHFQEMKVARLLYKAIPAIYHRYPCEEDLYALFRVGARLVRRDLSSAILMGDRPKFSDSRKNTIRKAMRQGIEIQEGVPIDEFHALLSDALIKHDAKPVHSSAELELLMGRFPNRIKLYGAYEGKVLRAASMIYDYHTVAHTQYLASSSRGREQGALDVLLADLIEKVYATKNYFSFGISTEADGMYLNEGLIFQKEGFGGRGIVHEFYEIIL